MDTTTQPSKRVPAIWLDANNHALIEMFPGDSTSTCITIHPEGPRLEVIALSEVALYKRLYAKLGEDAYVVGILNCLATILSRDLPKRPVANALMQEALVALKGHCKDWQAVIKAYNRAAIHKCRLPLTSLEDVEKQLHKLVGHVMHDILEVNKDRAQQLASSGESTATPQPRSRQKAPAGSSQATPKRAKVAGKTQKDRFIELIMEGTKTEAEIFSIVKAEFGLDDNKKGYVKWYWKHLSKEGKNPPPLKGSKA